MEHLSALLAEVAAQAVSSALRLAAASDAPVSSLSRQAKVASRSARNRRYYEARKRKRAGEVPRTSTHSSAAPLVGPAGRIMPTASDTFLTPDSDKPSLKADPLDDLFTPSRLTKSMEMNVPHSANHASDSDVIQTLSDIVPQDLDGFKTPSDAPESETNSSPSPPPSPPSPRPPSSTPTPTPPSACARVHATPQGQKSARSKTAATAVESGEGERLSKEPPKTLNPAWLQAWVEDSRYAGIPVLAEYQRMHQWYATRDLRPTQRAFESWLDRYEAPLPAPLKMGHDPSSSSGQAGPAKSFFSGTVVDRIAKRSWLSAGVASAEVKGS